MRSLKMMGHAWVALGGTCKVQRGLKGELHPLKNLILSAQQVTRLVISVVWSLCGQLCALIAPGCNHWFIWYLTETEKLCKLSVA